MKKLAPKLVLIAFVISLSGYAQKNHKRTFTEEFNTNSDVTIDVDTRYTNVIIETWNKNKVEVEATILVEGVSEKNAERTLKNWKFKALGNKSSVEISAKNNSVLIGSYNNNLNFELAENMPQFIENNDHILRVEGLDFKHISPLISDSFHIEMDSMVWPKLESFSFDYDKFQHDENYLKEWQKSFTKNGKLQRKELEQLAKNAKKLAESFERNGAHAKKLEELKKHVEEREKHMKIREKELKRSLEKRKLAQEKRMKAKLKELNLKNNNERRIIVNGHPVSSSKNYAIAQALESRDKMKVKRTIIIKAPKGAKFKMNVRYGDISFPN